MTLEQARAELGTLTSRLVAAYPETDRGLTTGAVPLAEKASGPARPLVLAIFGLSLAVLLIASANVASLTLARVLARGRELAVRAALGAGRARLTWLLVAEGVLVGALGAAGGLAACVDQPQGSDAVPAADCPAAARDAGPHAGTDRFRRRGGAAVERGRGDRAALAARRSRARGGRP